MILGVLLAGGASVRMGRDKGALPVAASDAQDAHETLGARAVRVLRSVCDDVVCLGHGRGVPDEIARIPDVVEGEGPLPALAHALSVRDADVYVVLPVDMPGVDGALLARLLEARAANDALAACIEVGGVIEPLPAVLARAAAARLSDAVAQGERRLGHATRGLSPVFVTLASMPANLNEPGDVEAWSRR